MDDNHFDRLSDDLLRLIFNGVIDANSLSSCLSVSKRFASVASQVTSVSVVIPRRKKYSGDQISKPNQGDGEVSFLKNMIDKFVIRPLHFLHRIIARGSSFDSDDADDDDDSFQSADEVLKSFDEVKNLQIQLPSYGGEVGSDGSDSLLKWKAEFGSELRSCVILCATSFQQNDHHHHPTTDDDSKSKNIDDKNEQTETREFEVSESILRSDELKLRIMWSISCIIAASARHYSLKQTIEKRSSLRKVVVTDEKRQGRLCMNQEQIADMRSCLDSDSKLTPLEYPCGGRTRVPALSMKMCHVRSLELPVAGKVMKGATLVVIRAVDGVKKMEGGDDVELLEGAFDGDMEEDALYEAVKEMMKKKKNTFDLEMDSF